MTTDSATQRTAHRAAVDALETMTRLDQYETRTVRQDEDYGASIRAWNDAADLLPGLPRMSDEGRLIGEDAGHRATRALLAYDKSLTAAEVTDLYPERRAVVEAASGLGRTSMDSNLRDLVRDGGEQTFVFPTGQELRAIVNFSHSDQLYTADFSSRVAYYMRGVSPWLSLATVVRSDNGRPLVVPGLSGDITSFSNGEGTAITPSDGIWTDTTLVTTGYKSLTLLSAEAIADAEFPLVDTIARSAGRAIGLAFGADVTTAVVAAATNGGTAVGTPFFALDDMLDLAWDAAPGYRQSASWVMATGALSKAARWTTSAGELLWDPGAIVSGAPRTLVGYPTYEDSALTTPGSATSSILFGDMTAVVLKVVDLKVSVSTDYLFNTDQVAVKCVFRGGAVLPDAAAVRKLISGNT